MEIERYPIQSVDKMGYSLDQIAKMAKLGLVLNSAGANENDGMVDYAISFSFVADSPMGRANRIAGTEDYEILGTCIEDARELPYQTFVEKYPSLAPFAE